jgi:hypothetical protein
MTTPPELSDAVLEWARRAGYELTVDQESGALILWSNPGGEIRYFVRQQDDGWLVLTRASRGGDEKLKLRAASPKALEYALTGVFGDAVRAALGMRALRTPWGPSDLAPGWAVSEQADNEWILNDPSRNPIAVAEGSPSALMELVPLSNYLQLSMANLQASFLSDDGAPLLSGGAYARLT